MAMPLSSDSQATVQGEGEIFISHASEDHETAQELVTRLEERGLSCWIAPRDIRLGQEWPDEIVRGIARCKFFVLLLSSSSNLSTDVRREVERAASLSKPIFPVRIEDVQPSPKLEYFISMIQWLDAWPRLMGAHVERLIRALQADEKWTGNRLRRRRRLSFGLTVVLAVAAIISGVTLVPELHNLLLSPQAKARNELRADSIGLDVNGVMGALVGADGRILRTLSEAGISSSQIAQALSEEYRSSHRSVAAIFFERSRNSPEAMGWFSDALAHGLDPNLLTFGGTYYKEQGLLGSAIAEGNLGASLALLRNGASPHVYQSIWFTKYPVIRLLFPLPFVLDNQRFTREEKHVLTLALIRAGAVSFKPVGHMKGNLTTAQLSTIDNLFERSPVELGVELTQTPPDRRGVARPNCRFWLMQSKFDWCAFADELPNRFKLSKGHSFADIYDLELRNLVFANKSAAYFLAVLNASSSYEVPDIAVVEVFKESTEWSLYKFSSPGAGLGFCQKDDDGYQPSRCWRKFSLVYSGENHQVTLEDSAILTGFRQ